MEVKLATEMGFCYGVRRALSLLDEASHRYGNLQTLGHIVHNEQVVERLSQKGISPVNNIAELKNSIVAITTHGVGPGVLGELKSRSLNIVDTTCPWVNREQKAARRLAEAGFSVVIFGDADHPEVKGVLEWAGISGRVSKEPSIKNLFTKYPRRLGILSQTTQNPQAFKEFVKSIIDELLPSGMEIRIINTICDATQKRQEAAVELAGTVDAMIVIGGKGSANTRRLAEICQARGVPTHSVETVKELQDSWFTGKCSIGVTAGASTPDEVIQEIVGKIKNMDAGVNCNTTNSVYIST